VPIWLSIGVWGFLSGFIILALLSFAMTEQTNQPSPLPPEQKHSSRGFAYLRSCFLTGILVTAPVALSLYIVWSILIWIDQKVGQIIPLDIIPLKMTGEGSVPGLGIIIATLFFIMVGWFARNFIGQMFLDFSNYVMERLPLVKVVYSAIKQVFEMLMGQQAQAFREVVLVEFPLRGSWSIGLLAGKTDGGMKETLGEGFLNVFVPTTPNPTSGFLILVHESEVKRVDMTVDEGLKAIISCGLAMPKSNSQKVS
jgi:uncharacterized membrane protein